MLSFRKEVSALKTMTIIFFACCLILVISVGAIGARWAYGNYQSTKEFSSAEKESLETYHTATSKEEKYPSAINLAQLYSQKNDRENAIKYLILAEEHAGGNDPNIYMAIASQAIELNEKETAIDYLEKATAAYRQQLPDAAFSKIKQSNQDTINKLLKTD